MLRLENVKIREDLEKDDVLAEACRRYRVDRADVSEFYIFKKSIDARNKADIFYNYTVDVCVKNEDKYKRIKRVERVCSEIEVDVKRRSECSPVIVGAGPAGLFAGLVLVNNGLRPIIVEQGKRVEDRKRDVDEFINGGKLNVRSNIQFGEGGAGTFSDGKLTSGIHSVYCRNVLEEFVRFGAPEQILYVNKPHIGTDNLVKIISNMRNYIIENGGEFLFEEKVVDLDFADGRVSCVVTDRRRIETDTVVLAIGHSARDMFEVLHEKNVKMERKNFSVGVRIEHKQEMINLSQYGDKCGLMLPAAEYKLAYHNPETGRSCYTFCMCPGGYVMASSSEEGTIVTNGMSRFARDGENANSAVLVNVVPEDFEGTNPLAGLDFQRNLERKAFVFGGENYFAPVQRFGDFVENRKSEGFGKIVPTYRPGVRCSDLNEILPDFVARTLKEGIRYFDTKIKGFADEDAILTGVETRSSSPVRIVRDEFLQSESVRGLYPCGEGPGYAGGIMSAAVDGIKCAIAILECE